MNSLGTVCTLLLCFTRNLFVIGQEISGHNVDPYSQFICNGKVFEKRNEFDCCGDEVYSIKSAKCVGETLYQIDEPFESCSRQDGRYEVYNSKTHTCCGGYVNETQSDHICCNDIYMDQKTDTCCIGPRGNFQQIVPGIGSCCLSTDGYNFQLFSRKSQICCNGAIHDSNITITREKQQCCDQELFDVEVDICCNGVIHERSEFSKCCMTQVYDERSQFCSVWDTVVDKLDGKSKTCGITYYNRIPYDDNREACCERDGVYKIDNKQDHCCSHTSDMVPTPSTSGRSSCCGESLTEGIPFIEQVTDCCSGVAYLKSAQKCCSGQLHDITGRQGMECCGTDLFDTATHFCCSSVLHVKSSEPQSCCGSLAYNPMTHSCGNFSNIVPGAHMDFCSGELYDQSLQSCCEGVLHDITGNSDKCCGSHLVSMDSHLCFNGYDGFEPVPASPEDDSICYGHSSGKKFAYNSAMTVCTRFGTLKVLRSDERRCGSDTYKPADELCCENTKYPRFVDSENERYCCGVFDYDKRKKACHNGILSPIPEEFARYTENYKAYDSRTEKVNYEGYVGSIENVDNYGSACFLQSGEIEWYSKRAGKVCCYHHVMDVPGGGIGDCCDGQPFKVEKQICCTGTLHDISEYTDPQCCGRKVYDEETHLCKDEVIYSPNQLLCGGHIFQDDGIHQCCGVQTFNPQTHICCDEFVYNLADGDTCCGRIPYNSENVTTLCCQETLYESADGQACCGSLAIDPNEQFCCNTTSTDVPFALEDHALCCSGRLDIGERDTCCGGVTHFGVQDGICCGVDLINPIDGYFCDDGEKFNIFKSDPSCAGMPLNNTHQGCCHGEIYDLKSEVCHRGRVLAFCDNSPYDKKLSGCCRDTIYDIASKLCFEGDVVDLSLELCNDIPYNADTHVCCNNRIRKIKNGKRECCGTKNYNPSVSTCCSGRLSAIRDGVCCGQQAYDPQMMSEEDKINCCPGGYKFDIVSQLCELDVPECPICPDERVDRNDLKSKICDSSMVTQISAKIRSYQFNEEGAWFAVRQPEVVSDSCDHCSEEVVEKVFFPLNCNCSSIATRERYIILSSSLPHDGNLVLTHQDVLLPFAKNAKYADRVHSRNQC